MFPKSPANAVVEEVKPPVPPKSVNQSTKRQRNQSNSSKNNKETKPTKPPTPRRQSDRQKRQVVVNAEVKKEDELRLRNLIAEKTQRVVKAEAKAPQRNSILLTQRKNRVIDEDVEAEASVFIGLFNVSL